MSGVLNWALARAREPSTWAGLAGIGAGLGLSGEVYAAVVPVLIALAGLAAVVLKEKPKA